VCSSDLLPAAAIACHGQGKLACLGSIEILSSLNPEVAEYLAFLETLLEFVSGLHGTTFSVLILGLPQIAGGQIVQNLGTLGLSAERSDDLKPLSKFRVVITLSSCQYGPELSEYLNQGGGLLCCAVPSLDLSAHVLNPYLMKFGLAFCPYHVVTPEARREAMRVFMRAHELSKWRLESLIESYQGIINSADPEIGELAHVIQALRFHLSCFTYGEAQEFETVCEESWAFLRKTTYEQPEGLCHGEAQQLVAVLICDIMMRTDSSKFAEATRHLASHFPGVYEPEKLDNGRVVLEYQPDFLQFTGFWLPAGVVSTVTCSRANIKGISLQIGIHSQNLLETPAPWKRWPIVTKTFAVDQFPVQISSPFGGLVYIFHSSESRFKSNSVQFRFSNVTRAPLYQNDSTWISTRALGPPWAEIETQYVIFTVPADIVRASGSFRYLNRIFDALTPELFVFMGVKGHPRFRVVFDIDLPKGGSVSVSPLMMSYDSIEGILLMKGPTSDLFAVFMAIAITFLPDGALSPHVEAAIGALAAAHIFAKAWPKVSPFDFTFERMSPLFVELWSIYQRNDRKMFPGILARFAEAQAQRPTEPEESGRFIIAEVTAAAGKDFPDLVEKMHKPADAQLPEYYFEEDDQG
jgi:hypothetical protein